MKKINLMITIFTCILLVTGCSFIQSKTEKSDETEICTETVNFQNMLDGKPVIYLYPKEEQSVSVKLVYNGKLTCTYPEYMNGWSLMAKPDGTLTNLLDNRQYSYLYWEGITDVKLDMSKGLVVAASDTVRFLQEKLEYMGLTPKEYNEFIVYWLPILQENNYNLITFAGKDYEALAKLIIDPEPDSILRIMMLYKPLEEPIEVEAQKLEPFIRTGFTVVEWGGTEVK